MATSLTGEERREKKGKKKNPVALPGRGRPPNILWENGSQPISEAAIREGEGKRRWSAEH